MHLLVTGREGQLAQALLAAAGPSLRVTALGRPQLDVTDPASLSRAIAAYRPDILVNAAAFTAVDRAESEADAAFAVNRDGARNAAAAAAAAGLPIIQISTDYVFAGDKGAPYTEEDEARPLSIYGRSKLAGEEAVAQANAHHAVLRTAWVHSHFGSNFLKTMLRLARERDMIRVVADQRGTPTFASDAAAATLAVASHILADAEAQDWRGVFHMVNRGETTWAGFAAEIFVRSTARGGPAARVEPITTADYPTPAQRPADTRLDTSKFETVFRRALPSWQDGVDRCLDTLPERFSI